MKLTDILALDCIRVPLNATAKREAITELVDLLADSGRITDRDGVLKAVLEREATRSTGIGHGLAVPHCKTSACDRLIAAIGKPPQPLDFESKDGEPVNFVVLLASPMDQTGPHIQALARISRMMLTAAFRVELAEASTAEQVLSIISKYES